MDIFVVFESVLTVVTFVTFIGIVVWAYSRRREQRFALAANAPFALPDEGAPESIAERQS